MNVSPESRVKRATIEDVAKLAGVSRQTVSRAVNDKAEIDAETKRRVLDAARSLNYRPSRFARGLIRQDTTTLGLIISDIGNPFFPELASGVLRAAQDRGWQVVLYDTGEDPEREVLALSTLAVSAPVSAHGLRVRLGSPGLLPRPRRQRMFPRRHLAPTSESVKALAAVFAGAALALSACSAAGGGSASSSGGDDNTITFLTFETPNLTPAYWDAAIKRVTDKYPGMKVKRLVSPTADRTSYAKQLKASGQFPDVLIAVTPTGFAQAGDLYSWQPGELADFEVPDGGAIGGHVYQLPANTQTIPMVYYRKSMFAKHS